MRRSFAWLNLSQPNFKDPFTTLGLRRSASKDDVKVAYRQLAKQFHPDAGIANSATEAAINKQKMEEVNRAYNLLLKEGMYEQLYVPTAGLANEEFDKWRKGAEQEIDGTNIDIGLLDPETERITPVGQFMYQHRNTGRWHVLKQAIGKPEKPRYASFSQQQRSADLFEEIKNNSDAAAAEDKAAKTARRKSRYQRWRFIHRDYIPFDSHLAAWLMFLIWCFVMYAIYYRYIAKRMIFDARWQYWGEIREHKEVVEAEYLKFQSELEICAAALTLIFLAAAEKADAEAPITPKTPTDLKAKPPGFLHLVYNTN